MNRNRILAILATLGIVGAGVVGAKQVCVDSESVVMFPAETLVLREFADDRVLEVGEICFKDRRDYETFKDDHIDAYVGEKPEERAKYMLTNDGRMLGDVLTHETQKLDGGIVQFPLSSGDDMVLEYIRAINQ